MFDLDDNLFYLNTKIPIDKFKYGKWKKIYLSTREFAEIRDNKNYRLRKDSFYYFGDHPEKNYLFEDIKKALKDENFGLSFKTFK
jgi:hypothetical protein